MESNHRFHHVKMIRYHYVIGTNLLLYYKTVKVIKTVLAVPTGLEPAISTVTGWHHAPMYAAVLFVEPVAVDATSLGLLVWGEGLEPSTSGTSLQCFNLPSELPPHLFL